MRVLTIVIALGLVGCSSPELDPAPEWVPWETIEGNLRPEVSLAANPADGQTRLRVLTFNTRRGHSIETVARYILDQRDLRQANLVLLQEPEHHPDLGPSDVAQVAAALGMSYVYAPSGEVDAGMGTGGLAILSRFALRDIEVMYLQEAPELGIIEPTAHGALAVVIDTPRGPVRVINVHLGVGLNIIERIWQLRPAVLETPPLAVVAGDFNTNDYVWADRTIPLLPLNAVNDDSSQAPKLDAYMSGIGYATPTASFGATRGGIPEDQRLDAIFTRGMEPGDGGVDRGLDTSDHWPVWLDLEVTRLRVP